MEPQCEPARLTRLGVTNHIGQAVIRPGTEDIRKLTEEA